MKNCACQKNDFIFVYKRDGKSHLNVDVFIGIAVAFCQNNLNGKTHLYR